MVSVLFSEASAMVSQEGTFWSGVSDYFGAMFKKVGEIGLPTWIVLAVLVAAGALLLMMGRKRQSWNAATISYAALAIALSFLLSHIRLYRMPQGGSVTVASMLPLMLFSYAFGIVPGLVSGVAYGILEFFQEPFLLPIAPLYAVCQLLLDYIIAFGCIGLTAVFHGKKRKDTIALSCGIALAAFLRFACSTASGVLFFAEYAGDQNPLIYSIVYNGSYMLPEMLICIALGVAVGPRLCKIMYKSAKITR